MSDSPFQPDFDELPEVLPIFPLKGVLLLPGSRLPLNIFEPRYLNMVLWALGEGRMIGMIQPTSRREDSPPKSQGETVYNTGCAGRISSFQETDDGRLLIVLMGVSRFNVKQEEAMHEGFRLVTPEWSPYRQDLVPDGSTERRNTLLEVAPDFFDSKGMSADWSMVKSADDRELVNTLALVCPFDPIEKQALLEAASIDERAKLLISMMQMSMSEQDGQSRSKH